MDNTLLTVPPCFMLPVCLSVLQMKQTATQDMYNDSEAVSVLLEDSWY